MNLTEGIVVWVALMVVGWGSQGWHGFLSGFAVWLIWSALLRLNATVNQALLAWSMEASATQTLLSELSRKLKVD